MIPDFLPDGNLPAGIHEAEWREIVLRFGNNPHRITLLHGLLLALRNLKQAGCRRAYINGSFVTAKEGHNDFDVAWETDNVRTYLLHPALLDFSNRRAAQQRAFGGELFFADAYADEHGRTFTEFFQTDREGNAKGIVAIDLRTLL